MRVFKSKKFARFARRSGLEDNHLCRAVAEIESGLVDADLGGGVFKQRVRRSGEGKSGGFRVILVLHFGQLCIFVYGFAKSDQANITFADVAVYREIAKNLLAREDLLQEALRDGKLLEVKCDGERISE